MRQQSSSNAKEIDIEKLKVKITDLRSKGPIKKYPEEGSFAFAR